MGDIQQINEEHVFARGGLMSRVILESVTSKYFTQMSSVEGQIYQQQGQGNQFETLTVLRKFCESPGKVLFLIYFS